MENDVIYHWNDEEIVESEEQNGRNEKNNKNPLPTVQIQP